MNRENKQILTCQEKYKSNTKKLSKGADEKQETKNSTVCDKTKERIKCKTEKQILQKSYFEQLEQKAQELAEKQHSERKVLQKLKKMYNLKIQQAKAIQQLRLDEKAKFQSQICKKEEQIQKQATEIEQLTQKIEQLTKINDLKQSFVFFGESSKSFRVSTHSKQIEMTCADRSSYMNQISSSQLSDYLIQLIKQNTIKEHEPIYEILSELTIKMFELVEIQPTQFLTENILDLVQEQLDSLNEYFAQKASKNITHIEQLLGFMQKSDQNLLKELNKNKPTEENQKGKQSDKIQRKSIVHRILRISQQDQTF